MSPYRILSLDGGGMRGLITAILLNRLAASYPGFLSQIDLFAGTSTGGVMALGLAAGFSPEQGVYLYEHQGPSVFKDGILDNLFDLGSLIGANYSTHPLKEVLNEHFGALRLGDLPGKVLISSFDLDGLIQKTKGQADGAGQTVRSWKAKFFHNFPGPGSDAAEKVVDVALRTAAAPTYFPIYQGYIDGGVVAPNPSLCALAQALHAQSGGQKLEDITLLSISTGSNPRYLEAEHADWGLVQWAPHMINLAMEASANLAHYQCKQLLGERYLRIDPILPYPIALDGIGQIPQMKEFAGNYDLSQAIAWLRRYFPAGSNLAV